MKRKVSLICGTTYLRTNTPLATPRPGRIDFLSEMTRAALWGVAYVLVGQSFGSLQIHSAIGRKGQPLTAALAPWAAPLGGTPSPSYSPLSPSSGATALRLLLSGRPFSTILRGRSR